MSPGLPRATRFCGELGQRVVTGTMYPALIADHMWTLASRSALPVLATTLPTGMVVALQGLNVFDLFGAQRLLSSLISVAVFRELSPVLSSMLVAAQGGASFAAELGSMRIQEEIDATEVMAIDSLRLHVLPRVIAAVITTPLMHLLGTGAGIAGGWVVAVLMRGEPSGVYWANLWALTQPLDLWGGVLKTAVFGLIIGLTATYRGYFATGGAPGVGVAVNETVVQSVLGFVAANYVLTSLMYGSAP